MDTNAVRTIHLIHFAMFMLLAAGSQMQAQNTKTKYPAMAPLDQYMMERNSEIALARTAAPDSISHNAEVMVLTGKGYEVAAKGTNGFVCVVERSWETPADDPDFWNPKLRGPVCFNAPAAQFNIPLLLVRTQSILAGRTETQMFEDVKAAVDKGAVPPLQPGAMCYMLSKQGYLSDAGGHWHPHLMFFVPLTQPAAWGAGLPGSPVVAAVPSTDERTTTFLVPVDKWSDGTPASESH